MKDLINKFISLVLILVLVVIPVFQAHANHFLSPKSVSNNIARDIFTENMDPVLLKVLEKNGYTFEDLNAFYEILHPNEQTILAYFYRENLNKSERHYFLHKNGRIAILKINNIFDIRDDNYSFVHFSSSTEEFLKHLDLVVPQLKRSSYVIPLLPAAVLLSPLLLSSKKLWGPEIYKFFWTDVLNLVSLAIKSFDSVMENLSLFSVIVIGIGIIFSLSFRKSREIILRGLILFGPLLCLLFVWVPMLSGITVFMGVVSLLFLIVVIFYISKDRFFIKDPLVFKSSNESDKGLIGRILKLYDLFKYPSDEMWWIMQGARRAIIQAA